MKPTFVLVIFSIILISCSPVASDDLVATSVSKTVAAQLLVQQEKASSPVSVESSNTPSPIPTKQPSATAVPTNTPGPTNTPKPTNTLKPTNTPIPTSTPTTPPEPIILAGNGDNVINFDWDGAGLLHITYSGDSNFAVISYDSYGNYLDLLVNTIGSYEGTVPLDFVGDEDTTRFEVTASGPWEIQILPLDTVRKETIPGTFSGTGDEVIAFIGGTPDLAIIDASTADSNFAIWSYGKRDRDLLVNEIAPYSGTVMMARDTFMLVIKASGSWSIEIKSP